MNKEHIEFPASFRVIGVGSGIESIINQIKSFRFEGVSTEVVSTPYGCIPTDEDKLAIIVFKDNEDTANLIAKTFHEAGVLTIGFSDNANSSCFDSVLEGATSADYPEIIKSLLQPVVTPGYICYDFSDLSMILRDSGYFMVKRVSGESVEKAVENIQHEFKDIPLQDIENLSFHLFFNRERPNPIEMKEMASFSEMMSVIPDTVNIIWSVHFDDALHDNQTCLVAVLSVHSILPCFTFCS